MKIFTGEKVGLTLRSNQTDLFILIYFIEMLEFKRNNLDVYTCVI